MRTVFQSATSSEEMQAIFRSMLRERRSMALQTLSAFVEEETGYQPAKPYDPTTTETAMRGMLDAILHCDFLDLSFSEPVETLSAESVHNAIENTLQARPVYEALRLLFKAVESEKTEDDCEEGRLALAGALEQIAQDLRSVA